MPHYIFSQIFGSFIAGLLCVGMYWEQISAYSDELRAAGAPLVSATGPAFILCTFPLPTQTNLGYLFLIEFFVDSFIVSPLRLGSILQLRYAIHSTHIAFQTDLLASNSMLTSHNQGIVIWACLDPANPFVSPTSVPVVIGLAYGTMVWGFANISISTNLARDLGCRIVAAIFFGPEAFTYMNYSWISILVNVPATIFATAYYEFLMRDSLQKIGKGHAVHEEGEEGLSRHITKTGYMEQGYTNALMKKRTNGNANGDVESGEGVLGKHEA